MFITMLINRNEVVLLDVTVLTDVIGSLGFPIVCCYVLWKSNEKSNELHRQEVDELRKAIENNTNVITQLLERLKHE